MPPRVVFTNAANRDPRRLPHPPEIDVQSSRMYQNLVLNRVHSSSLPRHQEDTSAPSTSTIQQSFEAMLGTQPNLLVNSTFIQSESNLKDFHFYENLIEQKKKRLPPPAFAPQSPVSINIVESSTTTTSSSADATKVSHGFILVNERIPPLSCSRNPSRLSLSREQRTFGPRPVSAEL